MDTRCSEGSCSVSTAVSVITTEIDEVLYCQQQYNEQKVTFQSKIILYINKMKQKLKPTLLVSS